MNEIFITQSLLLPWKAVYSRWVFLTSIIVVLAGCGQPQSQGDQFESVAVARRNNAWNEKMALGALSKLRSGDLVLRTGNGVDSHMLRMMNRRDRTFSHCGVVMVEHNYPFVYHSIGGEDNPNGAIRRDSAVVFLSPRFCLGIGIARYSWNQAEIRRLGQVVRRFYNERRKFDMDFNLKTDDRLYCSEFVFKAILEAERDTAYIKPSHFLNYDYVGVDDLYLNPHARLIWQLHFK